MKFQELTNEEILFIYLRQEKFIEVHKDLIRQGEKLKSLPSRDLDATDEILIQSLAKMKNSEHIKILNDINSKLFPIVDLIQDSYPDLYNKIENIVEAPILEVSEESDES
jgi:hypothetical protein